MTVVDLADTVYKLVLAGGVVFGIIVSLRNSGQLNESQSKLTELHLSLNSRLDQLLAATSAHAFSEGAKHERATTASTAAAVIASAADVAHNVVAAAETSKPSTQC